MRICCIILAGGVSRRFGGDKLTAKFRGESVITRVCHAASRVADEVYISASSSGRASELGKYVREIVKGSIVDSDAVACEGPLRGIITAVKSLNCDRLLILPGDIPAITSDTLGRFVERVAAGKADAGSVVWGNGMVETLIQLVEPSYVAGLAEHICSTRRDVARPSDILRGSSRLLLVYAGNITDEPSELSNINTREDLEALKPRAPLSGFVNSDILLELGGSRGSHFWRAMSMASRGDHEAAALEYELEAGVYAEHGIVHLAAQCLGDAAYEAKRAGDEARAYELRSRGWEMLARLGF